MAPELPQLSTRIGVAIVAPVQYFLDHVLPPLHPQIKLDRVVAKLKRRNQRHRCPITKAGRWWGFKQDPDDAQRCNKTSYLNFPGIVNAIAKCGAPKRTVPTLQIRHNPQPGTYAEHRDEDSLPDAYLVSRGATNCEIRWEDIGVVGEYDMSPSGDLRTGSKVCWSMASMFKDPRRRFAFGYTIENTQMRLWFCDKTQILASEPFNFITDHETVTRAFLTFLYSEPHQLGWDTSIHKVVSGDAGVQYDFTVTSADGSTSVYRSLELIDGHNSSTVLGAGTRVWKVIQIVNDAPTGEPVVLKDTWIHEELAREGDTMEQVRQSDPSEQFQRAFSANFLTVLSHGDVLLHPRSQIPYHDRTRYHRENLKAYRKTKPLPDPSLSASRSRPPPPPLSSTESVLTGIRNHYRVVFKEICRPLSRSTPLFEIFTALEQTCVALDLLHRAGWIHRDISKGNIMIDDLGHARLTDLEYAKKMGDESIPEIPVGTAPFMSLEITSQSYRFTRLPEPSGQCNDQADNDSGDSSSSGEVYRLGMEMAKRLAERMARPISPSPPPKPDISLSPSPPPLKFDSGFRYNPLHDLESLFWVATYFLFTIAGGHREQKDAEQQDRIRRRLLYNNFQHSSVIRRDGTFRYDVQALPPRIQGIGLLLEEFRSELSTRFYDAEENCASITSSVAEGIHGSLANTLRKMSNADLVRESSVVVPQHGPANTKKRSREDDAAHLTIPRIKPPKRTRTGAARRDL